MAMAAAEVVSYEQVLGRWTEVDDEGVLPGRR
jgi:hypothetical protein